MSGNSDGSAVTHFGRQMRKERLARGWSIHELSAKMGIAAGHLSRIETGKRPPTANVATKCDDVFPDRRGWFSEFYSESRSWAPPGFRPWAEYEDAATTIRDWCPGILSGLVQTADYARAVLSVAPGATVEQVTARLASRMERQRRVFQRGNSPSVWFVIDEVALYRRAGSPEVMAAQMARLLDVAAMPRATVTVMPAVVHPGNESGFIIADSAAVYAEHIAGGYVFTEEEITTTTVARFDSLRAESYRASESQALIRRMIERWTATGARPATAAQTAVHASKSPRPRRA